MRGSESPQKPCHGAVSIYPVLKGTEQTSVLWYSGCDMWLALQLEQDFWQQHLSVALPNLLLAPASHLPD